MGARHAKQARKNLYKASEVRSQVRDPGNHWPFQGIEEPGAQQKQLPKYVGDFIIPSAGEHELYYPLGMDALETCMRAGMDVMEHGRYFLGMAALVTCMRSGMDVVLVWAWMPLVPVCGRKWTSISFGHGCSCFLYETGDMHELMALPSLLKPSYNKMLILWAWMFFVPAPVKHGRYFSLGMDALFSRMQSRTWTSLSVGHGCSDNLYAFEH